MVATRATFTPRAVLVPGVVTAPAPNAQPAGQNRQGTGTRSNSPPQPTPRTPRQTAPDLPTTTRPAGGTEKAGNGDRQKEFTTKDTKDTKKERARPHHQDTENTETHGEDRREWAVGREDQNRGPQPRHKGAPSASFTGGSLGTSG